MNGYTERILEILRQGDGYVSGQYISMKLGISRTAVWKHIRQLRDSGYYVEALPRSGYRLVFCPDLPTAMEIRPWLETGRLGSAIIFHPEVESTSSIASELALDGEPEGTVVIADRQSAGRGRMDRSWVSPSGQNLYMSVILRPPVPPWQAPQMSIVAVVAVVRAVEAVTASVRPGIKWPNDVICGGRKLAGILCELNSDLDMVHHLIVGIGLNVSMSQPSPELRGRATSLLMEGETELSRPRIAGELLNRLESAYLEWLEDGLSGFIPFWEERSVLTGKRVVIETPSGALEGSVRGLSPTGGLQVVQPGGSEVEILSGDVHVSSVSRGEAQGT
jgi:BirA family biotin operon repressor/biotin-[acetyl-CoA-carboxylase] ligase